ncbi:antigen-presenting glycoprotein CD1d isoform X3 [Meriones unguiculatus]|uniref:antigen-presenting glycoprotein CD1d isoform X3 n=1 Tax=Meriones unguiculatus TaxID=10047 RepID=UPI000B4EABC7|nr:antigen-presenting glycoprotein CD1d isoform X3 [Meriones unguiculatus]
MRWPPCLLLWLLAPAWGQSEGERRCAQTGGEQGRCGRRAALTARSRSPAQQNFTLRCLQISSFFNSSCSRTDGSAWLGDLQTHRWDNASDAIQFLRPWAQGTFSNEQWQKLQRVFQVYRLSFTRDIQELVKMFPEGHLHYPIELQMSAGCAVCPGNASESFLQVAYQGEHIVSFQGTSWQKAPEAPPWIELPIKVLNSDQGTKEEVQRLLNDTCPQFLRGLLEAGKTDLEKQEKPVAWLSEGLSPAHSHRQLVCHVSGFSPKPVWVMWMRGDQEEQNTHRGDVLPNADGTWYLQASLDVEAGAAAGLACWVKHSSLGGQPIVLYWAGGKPLTTGLLTLIVFMLLTVVSCMFIAVYHTRKRCFYQDIL